MEAVIYSITQTLKTHFLLDSCLQGFYGLTAQPKPSFLGKRGMMKKTPCSSSCLPFSDSEINLWQYDDFLMSEV